MKKRIITIILAAGILSSAAALSGCQSDNNAQAPDNTSSSTLTGILSDSQRASLESDAAALNSACKTFYAGVMSGTITPESLNADGTYVSAAPAPGSTVDEKKYAAYNATVLDAMKYSGINFDVSYFGFYAKSNNGQSQGTIVVYDPSNPYLRQLTELTTMQNLFFDTYEVTETSSADSYGSSSQSGGNLLDDILGTTADPESTASTINAASKTFYAGTLSGTITAGDKNADGTTVSAAASRGAAASKRKEAAQNATIKDALAYSGLTDTVTDSNIGNFAYYTSGSNKGTIVVYDASNSDLQQLSLSTKLGDLYT